MLRARRAPRQLLGIVIMLLALPSAGAAGPRMPAVGLTVAPAPAITRITPDRGQPGQQDLGVEITASMAHFAQGVTAVSFGPGITITGSRVIDGNRLTATLRIAADAPIGPRTVTLTTGSELLELANGFIVRRLPSQTQRFIYALGQSSATGDNPQTVSVFDTSSHAIVAAIPVGRGCWCVGADRITVSPDGATVYVTNDGDNTVSVIDTSTNIVTGTVNVNKPSAVAVSPDNRRLYVLSAYSPTAVHVVDTTTHATLASIPLSVPQAYGMALTPDGSRLYVSTYGTRSLKVVDTTTFSVVATIPVGVLPLAVEASADGALIYVTNLTCEAYIGCSPGTVSIVSTATNAVVRTAHVGNYPNDIKVAPGGSRAYVAHGSATPVFVIDSATASVAGAVVGSSLAYAVAFNPDSNLAYLAAGYSVQVVNTTVDAVAASVAVDPGQLGFMVAMAISPGAIRDIGLSGNLDFGVVAAGARVTRTLTITNAGNAPLSVSGLVFPAGFTASFGGATIAARSSQQVPVTFAPSHAGNHAGTIAAVGNQTSGSPTIAVSGYAATAATRDGDFDHDTATDVTVYRPANGGWFILRSGSAFSGASVYSWGVATDTPMPGDYDGDGTTDIAVYRPSSGHWFILQSTSGYTTSITYQWGTTGDLPMPGDFDGDGRSDLAVYRPSTGAWYALLSSTGFTGGLGYVWGIAGDVPVPGDYDGDGRTDIAVYRASTGHWFILQSTSSYATWVTYQWGTTGDIPVLGDYDGDNRRDLAIYRPATGAWFMLRSSSGYTAGAGYTWGASTDTPVPGDYDGDGRTDIAVYRPASGHWFILTSSSGYAVSATYQWGTAGDLPVVREQ